MSNSGGEASSLSKNYAPSSIGMNATSKFAVFDYPGVTQPATATTTATTSNTSFTAASTTTAKTTTTTTTTKTTKSSSAGVAVSGAAPSVATTGPVASSPARDATFQWGILSPRSNRATHLVVWTFSQLNKVDPADALVLPSSLTTALNNNNNKINNNDATTLVYYDPTATTTASTTFQWVSGGGNAMAMALCTSSSTEQQQQPHWHQTLLVDEWCEWERTVLRPACQSSSNDSNNNGKQTTKAQDASTSLPPALNSALQHLEQALSSSTTSSSSSFYLVASHETVADRCVCVTLLELLSSSSSSLSFSAFPSAVQFYLDFHRPAYQRAVEQAAQLVKTFQKQNPSSSSSQGTGAAAAAATTTEPLPTHSPSFQTILKQQQEGTTGVLGSGFFALLDSIFRGAVKDVFGQDMAEALPSTIVTKCSSPKHGDYQCTVAMSVFAALKKQTVKPASIRAPPDVAKAIIVALETTQKEQNYYMLADMQVNGPGFIVCRFESSFLQPRVNQLLQSGTLPTTDAASANSEKNRDYICVVDFSSPNIAKEMHVGHLRSTIIGEAVCRILEFNGYKVHRVNHTGDWGTQFGMLIQYLREEYPALSAQLRDNNNSAAVAELPNITDLTQFYKNAKKRFDEDAEFKKTAQLNVVQLQSGDPECRAIWQLLCDISRKEFSKVYNRLDVTAEEYGESFYNDKIPDVIKELEQHNMVSVEEGGAKCVFLGEGFAIPLMVQKSDGGYGYDSTDMAALKYRLQTLKADRIIIITDFSQGDHFKMIYAAGHKIGWVDRGQRLEHIGFGTVMGEDGKRFKTRSGETVRLVDLLDEARERMETSLKERIEQGKANITMEEVQEVAEAIGYGAVKYYDLRRNPTTNYKFSYDQMLDTKGDTAVYLLYARVRLESIATKAKAEYGVNLEDLLQQQKEGKVNIVLSHPSERNLAWHLLVFPDTMIQTLENLYPMYICEYVYKLAIAASDFVTQCKVLGSPEMNSRLLLCHTTVLAMKQCFDLLGIRHVKRI